MRSVWTCSMIAHSTWPGACDECGTFGMNAAPSFPSRDILITPKRLSYARETEKNLYESLIELTDSKQNEIQKLILQAFDQMHEFLLDETCSMDIPGIELSDQMTVKNGRDLKRCTGLIQEFVLIRLNEIIANKLLDSINLLMTTTWAP